MRLAPFLLSLALLPAGLTATAAAAPDAPDAGARQQQARVSLAASAAWVSKGGTVVLSGKVRGVRGRTTVTIYQKKLRRGSSWNVETRKRTTRKGAFRHRENILTGHRMYRACAKGRCSPEVTVRMGTPPPPAAKPTALTLTSMNASSIDAGVPFTVQGSATNLDGYAVQVQAYDAGSATWGGIGTATVAGGQWVATASVTTAGRSVPIRAFFPGAPGRGGSASNESPLTVFGWYYLYDTTALEEVAGDWCESTGYEINGVPYVKSVGFGTSCYDDGYGEANLSRSCSTFAATVGVDDEADSTDARWTAVVKADNVVVFNQSNIGFGQTIPVSLPITNTLRLRLEGVGGASSYGSDLVFGDARVRCAF